MHPHGLICSPLWLHVLPEGAFRARHGLEFRMATIRFNFWIPVWTDVLVALGFIVASRSSIEDNLRAGIAVGLVVGGAEEAAAMAVDRFDLVLRKCKGFIKCALRAGAPVAPVVTLGENKIIRQVLLPPGHRLGAITRALFPFCQRHLGFVPIVPYGRPFFGVWCTPRWCLSSRGSSRSWASHCQCRRSPNRPRRSSTTTTSATWPR